LTTHDHRDRVAMKNVGDPALHARIVDYPCSAAK
jgi:hypothetical protein